MFIITRELNGMTLFHYYSNLCLEREEMEIIMGNFKYTKQELEANRVLKYNQILSQNMLNDKSMSEARKTADDNIDSSIKLLNSLGYHNAVSAEINLAKARANEVKISHKPKVESWENIVQKAEEFTSENITLEDLLTQEEIDSAYRDAEQINTEFSYKTDIINKTDLCFLAIATGLQVIKSLIFPHIAEKFNYGNSFDPKERFAHNDKNIENSHREANDRFKDKHMKNHKNGYWINILYQTPPYDITKGSAALGINMGGAYHRLYTLGHDPILGWLFGTVNILTDIITLNNFQSYRVTRKPTMNITPNKVGLGTMFSESYQIVQDDYLNLPAAIFAQAQHFKSDVYTKVGLPVPVISVFNESFASSLYRNQYDALCFARDTKIVGASYIVSMIIDLIIGLSHSLFRGDSVSQKLYEVRTKKILLLSNTIASTSTIIDTYITHNPKHLDIGSLLSTTAHLFSDMRFFSKIKQEFIESEIQKRFQNEFNEIDQLYARLYSV